MTCSRSNTLNALRYAADKSYELPDRYLGLHRDSISLVTITNTGVDVFGEGGSKTRTDQRVTVGDGYVSTLSFDGYINPQLEQVSAKDIFLSGGLLTDKDYKLGPIVHAYTYCGTSGGMNYALFNPDYEDSNDIQLYFYVVNDSFPNGTYMKRIWSVEDGGISFKVYIRNIGTNLMDISAS